MKTRQMQSFRAVVELQKSLDDRIKSLKEESDELSVLIGEKLRLTDSNNASELQELREKLEGSTSDPKKKKIVKKKDQKSSWYQLDGISIYDGIGLKGELELYFKGLEESKAELERLTKVKHAIDDLINKGLKREFGCVMVMQNELPAQIAFTQTHTERKKYNFKAIISVPKDDSNHV